MKVAMRADGEAIAVLNRNESVFYFISAEAYKFMIDHIEDLELLSVAESRKMKEHKGSFR